MVLLLLLLLLLIASGYVVGGSGTAIHTQNSTYTQNKTHTITNTIIQNYKHNAHKITNMFQPNKEPKVE